MIHFISVLPKTNKEVRKEGDKESGVAVPGIDFNARWHFNWVALFQGGRLLGNCWSEGVALG